MPRARTSSYVKPVDAQFRRLDQGIDYQGKPGTNVVAIGLAHVDAVKSDPGGFGEVVYYTLLDGPMKGQQIYVGHAQPVVTAGQFVHAGDPVAMLTAHSGGNASNLPGWTEIGFAKGGVPQGAQTASSFQSFVKGLNGASTYASSNGGQNQAAPAAAPTVDSSGVFGATDTSTSQPAGPPDPTLTQPMIFAPGSGDVSGIPAQLWRQIINQPYANPDTIAYGQNAQTSTGA